MDLGQILIVSFTGVVAVSTVVYAFLTWKLVTETRRMREVQTEPRVSVRVQADHTGHPGYELIIRNDGQGVAKNVSFEFEGDPSYFRSSWVSRSPPRINQLPVIKDGLDYLEPNQVYRFPLGTVIAEEFERAAKSPWTFRTQYESLYGKRKKDICIVDFSQFRGMLFEPNHLDKIAKHLDSLRKDIHRLTEGYANVRIVTQTKEEFLQEREEFLEKTESEVVDNTETQPDTSE